MPGNRIAGTRSPNIQAKRRGRLYEIEINHDWCKSCYICIELCPKDVYSKSEKVSPKGTRLIEIKNLEACTGCMQCELLCPDLAISVMKEIKE